MLKDQSTCSAFGYGRYGQLGNECLSYSRVPLQISVPESIFSISAGDGHSALLTETHKLYTFGKNAYGQLGLGHTSPVTTPTLVVFLQNKKIEGVFCGSEHTLVITNEGEVFSWGLNIKGQLGLGDSMNRNSPTLVETVSSKITQFQGGSLDKGERIIQGSCGGLHSLLLSDRNKLLSCGQGLHYATGHNLQSDITRFTPIKSLEGMGKIDRIQAGLSHSAVIIQGNLFIWGKLHSTFSSPTQIIFEGPSPGVAKNKPSSPRSGNIEDLACGNNFCIVVIKGFIWFWGEGFGLSCQEPIKLQSEKMIKYVACGSSHAVGISFDNQLCVWGNNQYGQCLNIEKSNKPVFVNAYEGVVVFKVTCGAFHTIVLSDGLPGNEECEKGCGHLSELKKIKRMYEKLAKNCQDRSVDGMKPPKSSKYLTPFFEIGYNELCVDPEPIGRGGYGTVYKAKWRGSHVAVKKMKLEGNNDRFSEFLQECQTMMSVRHPNIVLFMGACTVKPNLAIILEYCGNGSLWDVLRNHNTPLPWYLRCKIALDTARGVNYLHNFPTPVLHRDLKSLNILLDDAMNAKLADFGWTRFKAETMTNKIGTYQWMAPEVIQGQEYSEKADVYSFGIILWELATRKPPFRELNGLQVSQEVVKNNLRPPLPKRCPEPFVKLMQRCWDKDCESRPSFELIIEDLENFLKFLERTAVN